MEKNPARSSSTDAQKMNPNPFAFPIYVNEKGRVRGNRAGVNLD